MFRFHKTKDIITLFHSPSIPASIRVLTLLKTASAHAVETATEDQASDHTHQNKSRRTEFELDVEEGVPTKDQLRTILEYIGNSGKIAEVVNGASGVEEALRRLDEGSFQRPVVVDWNNGKAIVGANESEILKMVSELPEETDSV